MDEKKVSITRMLAYWEPLVYVCELLDEGR